MPGSNSASYIRIFNMDSVLVWCSKNTVAKCCRYPERKDAPDGEAGLLGNRSRPRRCGMASGERNPHGAWPFRRAATPSGANDGPASPCAARSTRGDRNGLRILMHYLRNTTLAFQPLLIRRGGEQTATQCVETSAATCLAAEVLMERALVRS